MVLVIRENKQKEGKEKMAAVDLAILVALIITIGIAIKIYKD